jgi:hypothetical protein
VLIIGCPASYFVFQSFARHDAIRVTYLWARTAPLPVSERAADVEILGSMFTREFRVSFTADAATIAAWLNSSPGISGVSPAMSGTTRTYSITPGDGAGFAEVKVDDATGRVTIHTYWS